MTQDDGAATATDGSSDATARGDLNFALGCAAFVALLVVVGLTIYLWTL